MIFFEWCRKQQSFPEHAFSISYKVKTSVQYVLLIDDAIGSGATMNETARKLKAKGIAKTVVAIALTGSYKGFEVMGEV